LSLLEELLQFFFMVVAISASGALAPGPLLIATMDISLRSGRYAGVLAALGHMSFELPLVMAISFGVWSFLNNPRVSFIIGGVGAVALIIFGIFQARSSIKTISARNTAGKDPKLRLRLRGGGLLAAFLVGFLFTALNPYFLIWWFTAGLTLISEAIKIGAFTGILLMFAFHIWLDYAWLGAVGYTTAIGTRILNSRQIKLLSTALSLALAATVIFFGLMFLIQNLQII